VLQSRFRPDDEALSADEKGRVQLYRLISLLGAVLIPSLSVLYRASELNPATPAWTYLGLSGLFAGLFAVSYASRTVRRAYVPLMWGLMYIQMVWIAAAAVANGFADEHVLAVLLTYASIGVVIELGARSFRPILWFLAFGFLSVAGGLFLVPAPQTAPSILLSIMAVVGLTVGFSLQGRLTVREQRNLLDRLVETSPNAIIRLAGDGTILQASGRVDAVLGVSAEALRGRTYDDLEWDPEPFGEDSTEEKGPFAQVLRAGAPIQGVECSLRRPDGTRRFLSVHGAPLRGEDGEAVFHLQDITNRERRARSLQAAKGRYQALTDNFPDGAVFLFDEDLRYTLAGGQSLDAIGVSASDIEGATPHDLFPEDIARETAEYYRRAWAGEKNVFEQKFQGRCYRIRTLPVRDETDSIIAGMAVSQDVTERKERERRLERQNDLFERAQEIADVGAWEYDVETDTSRWTTEVYRIHGRSPEHDPALDDVIDYYHPDDQPRLEDAFDEAIEHGEPYDLELRLRTKEKSGGSARGGSRRRRTEKWSVSAVQFRTSPNGKSESSGWNDKTIFSSVPRRLPTSAPGSTTCRPRKRAGRKMPTGSSGIPSTPSRRPKPRSTCTIRRIARGCERRCAEP
jgi:PAS domain S-box-containing protein